MYRLYINGILMPVTPSSITIETPYNSDTFNLIDGTEISVGQSVGLKKISFDLLLPNKEYPFSMYRGGFKRADYYIKKIQNLKLHHFKTVLTTDKGKGINLNTTLESFNITHSSDNGIDVSVNISLKEYRHYGTKIGVIVDSKKEEAKKEEAQVLTPAVQRPADPPKPNTHTVQRGDCLWKLAKKYYGNGAEYMKIANANNISNPNLIIDGQVLIIP